MAEKQSFARTVLRHGALTKAAWVVVVGLSIPLCFLFLSHLVSTAHSVSAMPSFDPTPTPQAFFPIVLKNYPPLPDVTILSSNSYTSTWGSYIYVVGEVENRTSTNVRRLKVTATFRSSTGDVLGVGYNYTYQQVLGPGQRSAFKIMDDYPPGYAYYSLAVSYSETSEAPDDTLPILNLSECNSDKFSVVGEVQNDISSNVQSIKVCVTLYDLGGNVVNVDYNFARLQILESGHKSPFSVGFWDGPTAHASKSVIAYYDTTSTAPVSGLQVVNSSNWYDSFGDLHIAGEVKNNGSKTVEWVKVICTLYEASDNVLDVDYTYTDPHDIGSGQTAPFELVFFESLNCISGFASYDLKVEGQ